MKVPFTISRVIIIITEKAILGSADTKFKANFTAALALNWLVCVTRSSELVPYLFLFFKTLLEKAKSEGHEQ